MRKRNLFLLFSLLLNLIFIFLFVSKLQNPDIKEAVNGDESATLPQVIGQKSESEAGLFKVIKVIDGDTITLDNREVVRYIGIDTPEVSGGQECFARESTQKNEELVFGKEVKLEKDVSEKDRYGRLLRYVYVSKGEGEIFVNEYLVREGFATVVTFPPDVKYSELFKQAERDARENRRGLWRECEEEVSKVPQVSKEEGNIGQSGDWDCSNNVYNCSDFKTQAEAQAAFEACGGVNDDVHKLDADKDGRVCESLP